MARPSAVDASHRVLVYCRQCPVACDAPTISPLAAEARDLTFTRDDNPPRTYTFARAFGPSANQVDVFGTIAHPLVSDVLQGWNATVLAYGQTGTGKTYSMAGPALSGVLEGGEVPPEALLAAAGASAGILPRAIAQVFNTIATDTAHKYTVTVSYVQIYREAVYDLLGPAAGSPHARDTGLSLREDPDTGVYVENATWLPVFDAEACLHVVAAGSKNRAVAATLMNAHSSRSHAIFIMRVTRTTSLATTGAGGSDADVPSVQGLVQRVQRGTLYLVDLAGSERAKKSGAASSAGLLDDMRAINLSLSALGNVIAALATRAETNSGGGAGKAAKLVSRQVHVPYRDSKLTRLLQDSLGGNARTSLLITVSPHPDSASETLNTLEFGSRAAKVVVHARRNEVVDYRALYLALRAQAAGGAASGGSSNGGPSAPLLTPTEEAELKSLRREVERLTTALQDVQSERDALRQESSIMRLLMQPEAQAAKSSSAAFPDTPVASVASDQMSATAVSSVQLFMAAQRRERDKLECDLAAARAAAAASREREEGAQEELLRVLAEYRRAREKNKDSEREARNRVADLLDEVSELRTQADEWRSKCGAAETEAEELRVRVRGTMRDSVPADQVERVTELSKLYEQTIASLHSRVELLEARAAAQQDVTQQLAYALRTARAGALLTLAGAEGGDSDSDSSDSDGDHRAGGVRTPITAVPATAVTAPKGASDTSIVRAVIATTLPPVQHVTGSARLVVPGSGQQPQLQRPQQRVQPQPKPTVISVHPAAVATSSSGSSHMTALRPVQLHLSLSGAVAGHHGPGTPAPAVPSPPKRPASTPATFGALPPVARPTTATAAAVVAPRGGAVVSAASLQRQLMRAHGLS